MVTDQCRSSVARAVVGLTMQNNPLYQLKDIQTPDPIGFWPLAWGWWLIILLSIVILAFTIKWLIRYINNNKAKKQALAMLAEISKEPHPHKTVIAINDILKRVMLVYLSREQVASLNSASWANLLNTLASDKHKITADYVELAYQPKCSAQKADAYLEQAKTWIKHTLPLSSTQKLAAHNIVAQRINAPQSLHQNMAKEQSHV